MAASTTVPPSWTTYKAPVFGVEEIKLPKGHNLGPSSDKADAAYKRVGRVEAQQLGLTIKLLYDGDRVAQEVENMKELCKVDSDDLHVVDQAPVDVDYGTANTDLCQACAHHFKPWGDDPVEVTHWVILKSKFGHGLSVEFRAPLENLEETKKTAQTALSSLKWVDRTAVVKDISSQLVGSWTMNQTLPPWLASNGCLAMEDITTNYDANGTFTASKVVTEIQRKTGKKSNVQNRKMPGGTYKLFQESSGNNVQIMTIGEETGELFVRDGRIMDKNTFEFGKDNFLHRVKVPFWKRLGGKK